MDGFEYPTERHERRHAPDGYADYEGYRDWLRDEFLFRCVYCLHRERWNARPGGFELDHLLPVADNPELKLAYGNLLYACSTCNRYKSDLAGVPDPCRVAFGGCLRINENGSVEALSADGQRLIKILQLNTKNSIDFRSRWMRTFQALRESHPNLYAEHMAFPDDLPDLRTKRAPLNRKEGSPNDCWFARRERGELPETY